MLLNQLSVPYSLSSGLVTLRLDLSFKCGLKHTDLGCLYLSQCWMTVVNCCCVSSYMRCCGWGPGLCVPGFYVSKRGQHFANLSFLCPHYMKITHLCILFKALKSKVWVNFLSYLPSLIPKSHQIGKSHFPLSYVAIIYNFLCFMVSHCTQGFFYNWGFLFF